MLKINFVPDDYIKNNDSRRTNLLYLALFGTVMLGLCGAFVTIKLRQRTYSDKEKFANSKMLEAHESLRQFEELQIKRKVMIKAALTTAELIEPMPRSILLASLTNKLPSGASLMQVKLVQKKPKTAPATQTTTSKYEQAQAKKSATPQPQVSQEKLLETHINIEGIAPSDIQVASYIERLGSSHLLENVALIESTEHKQRTVSVADSSLTPMRRFKLTAMLRKNIQLTEADLNRLRTECKTAAFY